MYDIIMEKWNGFYDMSMYGNGRENDMDLSFQSPTRDTPKDLDSSYSFRTQGRFSSGSKLTGSPIKGSHDLAIHTFEGSDSGFGNTLDNSRMAFRSPMASPRWAHQNGDSLLGSRPCETASVPLTRTRSIASLDSSSHFGNSKKFQFSTEDHRKSLEESESRRSLLVQKLKDAKDTIQSQAQKINEIENSSKSHSFEMDEFKYKERDLRRKIETLEKERKEFQSARLESFRKIDSLHEQVKKLDSDSQCLQMEHDIAQSDKKQKSKTLEQTCSVMAQLELEGEKLKKTKESMTKEMAALKESLEISRARCEWLEGHSQDSKQELARLRGENTTMQREYKGTNEQFNKLKITITTLEEQNIAISKLLQALTEEKHRLSKQLEEKCDNLADLKADLASAVADRERFLQEKLDLHQRLQHSVHKNEHLSEAKSSLEAQVGELSADLAETKLKIDRKKEEINGVEHEFTAVKKVSEVLSMELTNTRGKLEKVLEANSTLEQTKKLAFKQHSLYEQEIKSLENQILNLRKSMESLKKDYLRSQEGSDNNTIKLKEEIRKLKHDRNDLENKLHEACTKLRQAEQNLKDHSEIQQRELDVWKDSSETLTASLMRKEMEIHTMQKKIQDLEEETGYLKVNHETYQGQYEELVDTRGEILGLREENRRLLQERAENQQVIQLLEMQKRILSKTSEGKLTTVYDAEQLKCKVDQLTAENGLLQDKLKEVHLKKDKFEDDKENVPSQITHSTDILIDLEKENNHLQEINAEMKEKLSRLEEANTRKSMEDDGREYLVKCTREETEQIAELQKQCSKLQKELEDSKAAQARQEDFILSLKEQSLEDVSEELNNMKRELEKLMGDIQGKDQEIEDLENQIQLTKQQLEVKDSIIQEQKKEIANAKNHKNENGVDDTAEIKELREKVSQLVKTRDDAIEDANELREALEDLQLMYEEDKQKMQEKINKELKAKDRQIESLEDQLNAATTQDIKKLKRGASRMDLLKAENKYLQNQLSRQQLSNPVEAITKRQDFDEDLDTFSEDTSLENTNSGKVPPLDLDQEIKDAEKKDMDSLSSFESDEDFGNLENNLLKTMHMSDDIKEKSFAQSNVNEMKNGSFKSKSNIQDSSKANELEKKSDSENSCKSLYVNSGLRKFSASLQKSPWHSTSSIGNADS